MIFNGSIYYVGYGKLYSINPLDGKLQLSVMIDESATERFAISDSIVYIGSKYVGYNDYYLFAYNIKNKSIELKVKVDSQINSIPVIFNKFIYFTTEKGYLYSISISKGEINWSKNINDHCESAPSIYKNSIYLVSNKYNSKGDLIGYLHAIDSKTGDTIWTKKLGKYNDTYWGVTPTISHDLIYFGWNNYLYAVNSNNGKNKWKYQTSGRIIIGTPCVTDNFVFIGDNNNYLYALDTNTGKLMWQFTASDWITTSPVYADELVCFGTHDGFLYTLDSNNGKMKWRFKTSDTIYRSPILFSYGSIYVGNDDGYFYALE